MSDIILARAELAALLTPIAPVRTGRAALETTSADLPVIVLWSTDDRPAAEQGYAATQHTRPVTVECKITATDDYDDELDNALRAIRQALKPPIGGAVLPSATAVRETGARFFHPADGSEIAVLQITLEIDYLERF